MRPGTAALGFLVLSILLPLDATPARAGGYGSALDPGRVDAFLSAAEDDDYLILDSSLSMELEYRPGDDGYFGQLRYVDEYLLRSREGVRSQQYVSLLESPSFRLDGIEIEILHPEGRTRRYHRGDLDWASRTEQDGKVYSLDTRRAWALLPGLSPGDRLRIVTRYRVKGLNGLPPFTFGGRDHPVLHMRLELELPSEQELLFHVSGSPALEADLIRRRDGKRRSWELWNVPAAADEALAGGVRTDRLEWLAQVTRIGRPLAPAAFAAGSDWPAVARGYYTRILPALEPSAELRALAAKITASRSDDLSRTEAVYRYVQEHCRYLGLFRGLEGVLPKSASQTHHDGFGDCKGLGAYLIALLRGAGIEAYPVLLETADDGAVDPTIPTLMQFNHFIVWAGVGDEGIWLDATVDACRAGVIPPVDAASPVLFLKPGEEGLRVLPRESWQPGLHDLLARGSLDPRGRLEMEVCDATRDNSATGLRIYLRNHGRRLDAKRYLDSLFPRNLKLAADSIRFENLEDLHAALHILVRCHTTAPLAHTSRQVFLPRRLADDPHLHLELGERLSPIDLRRLESRRYQWRFAIPSHMALAEAESVAVRGPGIEWSRRIVQRADSLFIFERISWDNILLPADAADSLQTALHRIDEAKDGFFELRTR